MTYEEILQELASLPPEGQKEATLLRFSTNVTLEQFLSGKTVAI